MPGFPIPSIDLSTFGGLTAFEGQALALDNAAARRLGEGGGYLVVEGDVTLVDVPPPTTP